MIDPEGNLVAGHNGEIKFDVLKEFFKSSFPYYKENKLLDEKPIKFDSESAKAADTARAFLEKSLPTKVRHGSLLPTAIITASSSARSMASCST